MINVGDSVKFLDVDSRWHTGKFMGHGKVVVNDSVFVMVPPARIKKYNQLNEDAIRASRKKDFNRLHDLIVRACATLLSPKMIPDRFETDDDELILTMGSVTIEPCAVAVETLTAFNDVPGWCVRVWKMTGGTRDEPPGMEDAEVFRSHVEDAVAKAVVDTIFQIHSENFWVDEGHARCYTDWREDEKLAKEYYHGVSYEDPGTSSRDEDAF